MSQGCSSVAGFTKTADIKISLPQHQFEDVLGFWRFAWRLMTFRITSFPANMLITRNRLWVGREISLPSRHVEFDAPDVDIRRVFLQILDIEKQANARQVSAD
jgi:hypothetical protein